MRRWGRQWARRIGTGQAVALALIAVALLASLGTWANHVVRASRFHTVASRVLRPGMNRAEAERVLGGAGIPLNYPGTGPERSRGYSILPLGITVFPIPGARYAELDVYFDGDRVSRWEIVTESEWF